MFKKCVSGFIALVVALSTATAAYATESLEKVKFLAAMKTTLDEVNRENEICGKYSDMSSVLENLIQSPYEFLLEAAVNVNDGEDEFQASFKNVLLADNSAGKMLDKLEADVTQIAGLSNKIGANFYVDGNRMAVHLPGISGSYYYIGADTTAEQWNQSAIGQQFPLAQEDMNSIKAYLKLFKNQGEAMTAKPPKGMNDKYAALTMKYINNASFYSDGEAVVEANRGMIGTEKITCSFSAPMLNNYTNELADTIKADEQLRGYLQKIYASYDNLGFNMTDTVIDSLVVALQELTFTNGLKYSVYISQNGYAIRQELAFAYNVEGEAADVVLGMNLLGTDYIMNEMKFTAEISDAESSVGGTVAWEGDVVPKNGVFDSTIFCKMFERAGGEEQFRGVLMNYKWDTNAKANNFKFDFASKENINKNVATILKTDQDAFRFVLKGDVALDKAGNTFAADFKDIRFEYGGSKITFSLKFSFKPADNKAIGIPDGKAVDLLSLSNAELEAMAEMLSDKYGI